MSNYEAAAKEFGTVTFEGREYALTSQADHTSRLLPDGYTNYNDASEGEAYDFEMSAGAIDKDGTEYTVYWLFEGRKGEHDYELDSYDYSDVARVVEQDKRDPGKGPTNLSGARGASPVLRVRMPAELLKAADEKAMQTGESLPAVVRELLRQWVRHTHPPSF